MPGVFAGHVMESDDGAVRAGGLIDQGAGKRIGLGRRWRGAKRAGLDLDFVHSFYPLILLSGAQPAAGHAGHAPAIAPPASRSPRSAEARVGAPTDEATSRCGSFPR